MYGYPPDRHDHWELENQINDIRRETNSLRYKDEESIGSLEYRVSELETELNSLRDRVYVLESSING